MENQAPAGSSTLNDKAVIKAMQVLASEMQPESFLLTLMQIVIDSSGAQKAALVSVEAQQLVLMAVCVQSQPCQLPMIPLTSAADLPIGLIQAVFESAAPIVSPNAIYPFGNQVSDQAGDPFGDQASWAADPYVLHHCPKSMLGLPLQRQRVIGILYVEHSTTPFSPEQIEFLRLLCTQVAVFLENACLRQELNSSAQMLRQRAEHHTQKLQQQERRAHHTEIALRESESRFREIFNSAVQFIGLFTPYGHILKANPSALGLGGLTLALEDIFGMLLHDTPWFRDLPDTHPQLIAGLQVAAQGKLCRFETQAQGKDGIIVYLDMSFKPLIDAEGQVYQILAEGRDVTDRKQAELALQISEERMRTLIDTLPFGVWVRDADDRLILQNPIDIARYGNQLGTRLEELSFAPGWTRYYNIKQNYKTGQFAQYEVIEPVDGEQRRWLRITAPLPERDGRIGMYGVAIDITERLNHGK